MFSGRNLLRSRNNWRARLSITTDRRTRSTVLNTCTIVHELSAVVGRSGSVARVRKSISILLLRMSLGRTRRRLLGAPILDTWPDGANVCAWRSACAATKEKQRAIRSTHRRCRGFAADGRSCRGHTGRPQCSARSLAATCANCHGTNGVSVGEVASLAGKPKDEIVRKMQDFKAGTGAGDDHAAAREGLHRRADRSSSPRGSRRRRAK